MAGFTLEDSTLLDDWQFFQTQILRDEAAAMLTRLVQWYAAQGESDYDQAIAYARRWLVLDPLQEAAHRYLMVLYARTGQRSAALRQYDECVRVLQEELGTTPAAETAALVARIRDGEMVETLPAIGRLAPTPRPGPCPFKGLQAFDVEDADLFFGREALTDRLVRHVAVGASFLAVVGASGSGKSSLVRAGLVAHLQHEEGSRSWDVHVLTPTADPLGALAHALLGDGVAAATVADCVAAMLTDAYALDRVCRGGVQALTGPDGSQPSAARYGGQRLLVVDQFEELFTLCQEPDWRRAFVDNLLAAAESADTRVVIALRADFYHRCGEYNGLREALEVRQVYVGAMTTDELRRAIEAPADAGGWTFKPGLVDLLLHDIGADARRSPEPRRTSPPLSRAARDLEASPRRSADAEGLR